jgi:hypothetical protein
MSGGPSGRPFAASRAATAISPLPGIAAIGVRAASDVGRCASRGSTGCALSAHPAPLRPRTPRSTTPSMSEAAEDNKRAGAGGDKCSRECDYIPGSPKRGRAERGCKFIIRLGEQLRASASRQKRPSRRHAAKCRDVTARASSVGAAAFLNHALATS